MSIYEFFIIPEVVFTTGIIFYFILTIKSFKNIKGEIDLIYFKNKDIERLSKENKRLLRTIILKVTLIITLLTALIGIIFFSYFKKSLLGLIVCLILQVLVSVILSLPLFKKLKKIKHSFDSNI